MGFEEPDRIRILFDGFAGYTLLSRVYRKYVDTFGLTGSEAVLDFGCGAGALSRHIAPRLLENGGRLTCLDPSQRWLEVVRKRLSGFPNVEFVHGDVTALADRRLAFDVIAIHLVLHDIEAGIRQQTIDALARTLTDTGRVFIREPTGGGHGISPAEVRELMAGAGLTELHAGEYRLMLVRPVYAGVFARTS